ncbi:TlpA disulfide reductase family protein [Persicobacter diffluens]|uniref:Thioredoxin domain-containing protein n=1 Tax=Persicobacter diffluens TaxID=981 RepID=A0AAN4VX49_9BACT|nr:hypothetical protein PEDI_10790 [Persicobacter diffluens]
MKNFFYFFVIGLLFTACEGKQDNAPDKIPFGNYRGIIQSQHKTFPFQFALEKEGKKKVAYLINGKERLPIHNFYLSDDSLHLPMHIFEASISAKWKYGELVGEFNKEYVKNYILPFKAFPHQTYRFDPAVSKEKQTGASFAGKWKTHFAHKPDSVYAMAIFQQEGDYLEGTFRTTTGDYRFLSGNVVGDSLFLSAFDGEHLYLFEAAKNGDQIEGDFWSGKGFHTQWTAVKDENFELPNAYEMTYLKNPEDEFDFSFPDLKGKQVTFSTDERFNGKPTIVQIFGTWCPNCMDETAFMADWYEKNKKRGIEIVGLAFERNDDFEHSKKRVEKVIKKYKVGYPFLIAGDKKNASAALPMLNKVMSFPTTIFIDKQGVVTKIHTGFNGPSTGAYYEEFIRDFNETVDELLK